MTTNFDAARAKWPSDVAGLPPHVQAVYQTWLGEMVPSLRNAAAASPVPITPHAADGNRYNKPMRARDLTLARTPWPAGIDSPPAVLTEAQVITFGGNGSSDGDQNPNPNDSAGEIAELKQMLRDQQISIAKLVRQQEALAEDKDATSAYEICDATLARLPASFRASVPMSRVDRRRLRRDHGGAYPPDKMPKELSLPEDVKSERNVAAHKVSLVALTKDIISPLMEGNMEVLRMVGTVHSRVTELLTEMQDAVENGQDSVVLASELMEELDTTAGAAAASMDLVLDLHARLRTVVTSRVERAMGFADLHEDPNKRGKETFLSTDFEAKIEEKAKAKAHMAWAKSGTGLPPKGSLHAQPPSKNAGGGSKQTRTGTKGGGGSGSKNGGAGGRGRGSGGRGRGSGGGRGNKSTDTPSDKS
jgi:uncharacterized membrane protein YgcG